MHNTKQPPEALHNNEGNTLLILSSPEGDSNANPPFCSIDLLFEEIGSCNTIFSRCFDIFT